MNYPNVPNLPGVPPVLRNPFATVALGVAATIAGNFLKSTDNWRISNQDGSTALSPDSFLSFENTSETNISDFPVEKGSFGTINKVIMPVRIELRVAIGGNETRRMAFEKSVEAMKTGGDTYTIYVPEGWFARMNLVAYNVRRTASSGVSLITYNLKFQEVREVTIATTNSAVPVSNQTTPTTSTGTINANNSPPQSQSKVKSGIVQAFPYNAAVISTSAW
ncbi:MAG: phage baseplate protein [Thiobacillus sp.]